MRPGEIRSLTWAGLDRETYTVRLHAKDAKTGYGRNIPVTGALRPIIERRLAAKRLDCPLIFHRHGRPVGISASAGRPPVPRSASRGSCSMTFDARHCATWSRPAWIQASRWRSAATERGACWIGA